MIKNKRHSLDFKTGIVEKILRGESSVKIISKEHSLAHSMVRRWLKQFGTYGIEGLKSRKGKVLYSQSFKIDVLRTIEEENLSLMEAMLRFKLPNQSVLVNWRKRMDEYGLEGLKPAPKGRPRMHQNDKTPYKRKKTASKEPLTREEQLQLELEYLRAENALLKKLHALVQKDNKRKP